jgi:hypothetical protein
MDSHLLFPSICVDIKYQGAKSRYPEVRLVRREQSGIVISSASIKRDISGVACLRSDGRNFENYTLASLLSRNGVS